MNNILQRLKVFPFIDGFAVLMILAISLKYVYGLENVLDILFYDESSYLHRGIMVTKSGFQGAQTAPLYAIWYSLLFLLQPDRVALYYLNYKLMTILPPILVYAVLRKNRVSMPISFVVSWFSLVTYANANVWPKVSHFAVSIILVTLFMIGFLKSRNLMLLIGSIGALLISYVRPEYFIAYLISVVHLGIVTVKDRKSAPKQHYIHLTIYILLCVCLLVKLGMPLSGDRAVFAFGQHFALNWVGWTKSALDPWTNWYTIFKQNFGDAQSIWGAFFNNPSVFLKHITSNLKAFIGWFYPFSFLPIFPSDRSSKIAVVLLLAGLCVTRFSVIRASLARNRPIFLFTAFLLVPLIASTIVIYPRNHYLLILFVLLLTGITILLAGNQETFYINYKQLILLGLLFFALTTFFANPNNAKQYNLRTLRFVESLQVSAPVNMLEADGGYFIYLGDNYHRVAQYDKSTGFNQFLEDQDINMIVISNDLMEDTRYMNDPEWLYFLKNYSQYGFESFPIKHTNRKLFVKTELLNR